MKDNIKISVIVPVYNTEQYLRRCFDSILAQTFTDFEVVVVDDGSTDASGEICDEYAAKDNRFRVFHTENRGVGAARQLAFDKMKGEYFASVDSDDYAEPNMLETLYRKAKEEDADIVIGGYRIWNKEITKGNEYYPDSTILKADDLLKHIFSAPIDHMLWNKMVRSELLNKYGIRIEENIQICEDFLLQARLYKHDLNISYLPTAIYNRVARNGSITDNLYYSIVRQKSFFYTIRKEFCFTITASCLACCMFNMFSIKYLDCNELRSLIKSKDIKYSIMHYDHPYIRYFILRLASFNNVTYNISFAIYNMFRKLKHM